jgi:hypothetical protein
MNNELEEIIKLAGIDKPLSEIIKVPPLTSSGIDFDSSIGGTEVFKVDNYPVYLIQAGHQDLYVARDGNIIVSQIVMDSIKLNKYGDSYLFTRVYTEPKYRGSGIALKMLVDIKKYSNKTIVCDIELTDNGMNLWDKIKNLYHVSLINIDDGNVIPISGNEDKIEDPKYTYIMEKHNLLSYVPESKSILKSFEYMLIESRDDLLDT